MKHTLPISFDDIRNAAENIRGAVKRTPFTQSITLSRLCEAEIFLKFENFQFTASFKERGALNKLLSLDEDQRRRGVVAMSAGNHAQGVAYHAARLGIPATIVMPEQTPFVKVRQTQVLGAKIVLSGKDVDEAARRAHQLQDADKLTFIHPYDDPLIIAGQGTIALEMFADVPDLDVLLVPVGGGGLIAGIATAARELRPATEVIGVEAELYPSMYSIFYGESAAPPPDLRRTATIAEGIAVKNVGTLTREICRELVSRIGLVSEAQLERAVALLINVEKTVAEGAGAAGLAELLARREDGVYRGKKIGLVICGGNIDARLLAAVLMRDLVREGRIARLRIEIADAPGALADVAGLIARGGGNIIDVTHQRLFAETAIKHADLDVALETRDEQQMREIVERIAAAGFPVRRLE